MYINQVNLQQKALSYGNNPQYLILHHADMNGSIQDVNQVHLNNGWAMIGYNYYIRKDGSVWKGRPENAIGANCYGYNDKSISICSEGNYEIDYMSPAMKASIIALGQDIENRYGHRLKVVGHKELYSTDCPGSHYPLSDIKNAIMNENYTVAATNIGFIPNGSIRQLQTIIGAISDGIAGSETLGKCPMLYVGSTGNTVKWLQYVLNSLDKEHLAMDGIFGNGTKQAVQRYQTIKGLNADGIAGQGTWSKILRLS